MIAILFNRVHERNTMEIEKPLDEIERIEKFKDVEYNVTYIKDFSDTKGRIIYSEKSRKPVNAD